MHHLAIAASTSSDRLLVKQLVNNVWVDVLLAVDSKTFGPLILRLEIAYHTSTLWGRSEESWNTCGFPEAHMWLFWLIMFECLSGTKLILWTKVISQWLFTLLQQNVLNHQWYSIRFVGSDCFNFWTTHLLTGWSFKRLLALWHKPYDESNFWHIRWSDFLGDHCSYFNCNIFQGSRSLDWRVAASWSVFNTFYLTKREI